MEKFVVVNKKTREKHKVYSIRYDNGNTLFLIYDKNRGWGWHSAYDYEPV